jgi:hypothetical protein
LCSSCPTHSHSPSAAGEKAGCLCNRGYR